MKKNLVLLIIAISLSLLSCNKRGDILENNSSSKPEVNEFVFSSEVKETNGINCFQKVYETKNYIFVGYDSFLAIDKKSKKIYPIADSINGFYYSGEYIIYQIRSKYYVINLSEKKDIKAIEIKKNTAFLEEPIIINNVIYWVSKSDTTNYKLVSTDLNGNDLKEMDDLFIDSYNKVKSYNGRYLIYTGTDGIVRYDTQTQSKDKLFSGRNYDIIQYTDQNIILSNYEYYDNIITKINVLIIDVLKKTSVDLIIDATKITNQKDQNFFVDTHDENNNIFIVALDRDEKTDRGKRYKIDINTSTVTFAGEIIFTAMVNEFIGSVHGYNYYLKGVLDSNEEKIKYFVLVKENTLTYKQETLPYIIEE